MSAGAARPSRPDDLIGSIITQGFWPGNEVLDDWDRIAAGARHRAAVQAHGAESADNARRTLITAYEAPHADAMHEALTAITRNHGVLPENSMTRAAALAQLEGVGHSLQVRLVEIVDRHREIVEAYCKAGFYQQAHLQLYGVARGEAAAAAHEAVAKGQPVITHMLGRTLGFTPMHKVKEGGWGGDTARADSDDRDSGQKATQVDHKTGGNKDDAGTNYGTDSEADKAATPEKNGGRGAEEDTARASSDRDATSTQDGRAPDDTARQTSYSSNGGRAGGGGRPGSAGGGPGMGSLGSGLGGSGGGSGMPGSDLAGGLGHGLGSGSGSGMSGFDPSHLASAHDGGSASTGFTSLSSGAGGSGGSVPPAVRPPVIPAAPASAAPAPTSAAPAAAPAPAPAPAAGAIPGAAGGFGRASAAAGGFMATPAAMSGPANVGAAPAASPGLAQGAPAGLASAGAAGAGAAAQPLGLTPAAMNGETPEGRIDEFGLAALEAVKRLAPAVARYPGLLLAAASVTDRDGPPFIVITTNEGAGWLPPGFVLPRTMFHAQSELGSIEFSNRWYGWADPARILVDYAKVAGLQVRGLASMGAISEDTNTAWGPEGVHRITGGPKAVPCVAADQGAQPLSDDGRGRFVHRLGVALPEFYRNLRAFWADRQPVVSVQAALEAWSQILLLDCATPLRRAGGAWSLIESRGGLGRGGLTTDEWASLRSEYESGSVMCGALRPGFRSDSSPGTGYDSAYGQQFRELRAMEALLWFEDGGEGDPADVVYTAAVVGASLDDVRTR